MGFHAGFDAAVYPGLPAMNWLQVHSNLAWCGYYLAPAPNLYPPAASWRGRRRELAAHWGLAPIYVGQQVNAGARDQFSAVLTVAQGMIDANQAADNARRDGFAAGTCLYLDWEDGGDLSPAARHYIGAWVTALHGRGFQPGIYCSHLLGAAMDELLRAASPRQQGRLWCYRVSSTEAHPLQTPLAHLPQTDPSGSGVIQASMWQHELNAWFDLPVAPVTAAMAVGKIPPGSSEGPATVRRIVADFSTSRLADPGKPA